MCLISVYLRNSFLWFCPPVDDFTAATLTISMKQRGANLETAFFEIFDGKTPAMWLKHSYPSLKLGDRLTELEGDSPCSINFTHGCCLILEKACENVLPKEVEQRITSRNHQSWRTQLVFTQEAIGRLYQWLGGETEILPDAWWMSTLWTFGVSMFQALTIP